MTYTVRLATVLEIEGDEPASNRVWQALKAYPLYDPAHPDDLLFDGQRRAEVNQRIIEHFYLREIAHESVSIFVFQLRKKLREIMPMYNKLYATEQLKFDPLSTINVTTKRNDATESSSNRSANATAANTGTATSRNVNQDFPQTELGGEEDYATNGAVAVSGSTGNTDSSTADTATDSSTASGESTSSGFQASPARLLTEFRSTILNIDMMVVTELDECFLQVFDLPGTTYSADYLDAGIYSNSPVFNPFYLGRTHP